MTFQSLLRNYRFIATHYATDMMIRCMIHVNFKDQQMSQQSRPIWIKNIHYYFQKVNKFYAINIRRKLFNIHNRHRKPFIDCIDLKMTLCSVKCFFHIINKIYLMNHHYVRTGTRIFFFLNFCVNNHDQS